MGTVSADKMEIITEFVVNEQVGVFTL